MKLKHLLIVPALALAFVAGLRAQPATTAPAAAPEAAAPATPAEPAEPVQQFTDEQIFEMLGWYMASNMPVNELEPTPELVSAIIKGARLALDGKPAPHDQEKIRPDMERVLMARQMAYQAKAKAKAEEESTKFFAEVKARPGAVVLPSGVVYEIVRPGEGAFPTAADTVKINYAGTLVDGKEFDSSYKRGEPAEFPLSGVIPGMTEGLQKINKGGKIKIYIPSELGYGERPPPSIPPFATLVFEVELLDIIPPQVPESMLEAAPVAVPVPTPAPAS
ncbi:MAG: FKBP-type peptidyl-prolyl cis-trans isomerase [Opitutaceae bacterium]|jgi:FKBP-type peptidyl-prolyl cis-trans isomerase|nr:FKBP-type peptidyl-prolyl cis-trans isomerase [Opitutaceae bacterium]